MLYGLLNEEKGGKHLGTISHRAFEVTWGLQQSTWNKETQGIAIHICILEHAVYVLAFKMFRDTRYTMAPTLGSWRDSKFKSRLL